MCGDRCCQECHALNIVWFIDSDIWNRVRPDGGVLCVRCFVLAAEAMGIGTVGAWKLAPEGAQAERDESDALRERMAGLLTGVANALKGDPGPLKMHDWSDLPTVAASVVAERDQMKSRVNQ